MHMNDGRVVSNFILQALQNESITVRECLLQLQFDFLSHYMYTAKQKKFFFFF